MSNVQSCFIPTTRNPVKKGTCMSMSLFSSPWLRWDSWTVWKSSYSKKWVGRQKKHLYTSCVFWKIGLVLFQQMDWRGTQLCWYNWYCIYIYVCVCVYDYVCICKSKEGWRTGQLTRLCGKSGCSPSSSRSVSVWPTMAVQPGPKHNIATVFKSCEKNVSQNC